MAGKSRQPVGLFAVRLAALFESHRRPDGREYSLREVADAINREAGERLGGITYISQLRSGESDNPTFKVIRGLARFFGVPPWYFFGTGDDGMDDAEAKATAAATDPRVRAIVLRSVGLSEQAIESVQQVMEQARDVPPETGGRP
jgi:transcriptional regulator with XRE-family HTH domain